jgi:phosphoheptose isomerase
MAGGRLLAVGNGGSAAQAQHLTSELVGRYRDDRRPFSAISLHAETSALTAIGNDYPPEELFARQVRAHGREGDVLLALSTSGRSPNVLGAAPTARRRHGLTTWALTGPPAEPARHEVDDAVVIDAPYTATCQEVHQVVVHLLCAAVDVAAARRSRLHECRVTRRSGGDRLSSWGTRCSTATSSAPSEGGEPRRTGARSCGPAPRAAPCAGPRPGRPSSPPDGADVVLLTCASPADPPVPSCARLLADAGWRSSDLVLAARRPRRCGCAPPGSRCSGWTGGTAGVVGPLAARHRGLLDRCDGVLVADYGRGVAAAADVRAALTALPPAHPRRVGPRTRGAGARPRRPPRHPERRRGRRARPRGGGTGVAAVTARATRSPPGGTPPRWR